MLILKSLTVQPMHGYAIVQHIARLSNGVFAVDHGSLYPALARLADERVGHRKVGRVSDEAPRTVLHHHRVAAGETRRESVRLRSSACRDRRRDVGQLSVAMGLLAAFRYRLRALMRPRRVRARAEGGDRLSPVAGNDAGRAGGRGRHAARRRAVCRTAAIRKRHALRRGDTSDEWIRIL